MRGCPSSGTCGALRAAQYKQIYTFRLFIVLCSCSLYILRTSRGRCAACSGSAPKSGCALSAGPAKIATNSCVRIAKALRAVRSRPGDIEKILDGNPQPATPLATVAAAAAAAAPSRAPRPTHHPGGVLRPPPSHRGVWIRPSTFLPPATNPEVCSRHFLLAMQLDPQMRSGRHDPWRQTTPQAQSPRGTHCLGRPGNRTEAPAGGGGHRWPSPAP